MRVITGTARGRKLEAPAGLETRPTSEMTKEALFSILHFEVEGAAVLDLFAGSGQLGIEALSRGARLAYFIDASKEANRCITANLAHTALADRARVSMMEAKTFLRSTMETFDIALLDPPYAADLLEDLLPRVAAQMHPAGVIVCETEKKAELPPWAGDFVKAKEYNYGKAKLTTYRHKGE